ncbi:MAG TPA: DUF167 domain-containing protein [Methylomirabilota bacterium]|nr:DUF167 domain-containing protein [Methylomirabilota bacterium]
MRTATKATLLRVRVQPRASRDEIVGWRADEVLGVRVTAAPVDGQANAAVTGLVAAKLGVPRSAVTVARGERGRDKLLRVAGLTPVEIRGRLGPGQGGS